jgi:hypothetical protein
MFDISRLPDIEDAPFLVFKQVDTRMGGKMVDFLA